MCFASSASRINFSIRGRDTSQSASCTSISHSARSRFFASLRSRSNCCGTSTQDFLQKLLAEVPVPHLAVDVFLNDRMPGLAENGCKRGQTEIRFGGIPVRREDQHHFHLPTAGLKGCPAVELNELLRRPIPLRILDFHSGLPTLFNYLNDWKANGLDSKKSIVRGLKNDMQEWERVTAIANTLAGVGHEQRPQPQYDRWRLDKRSGTETDGTGEARCRAQREASVRALQRWIRIP